MIIKKSVESLKELAEMKYSTGYIENLNVSVRLSRGAAVITDLTNAMKPGKECRVWSLESRNYGERDLPGDWLLEKFLEDFPFAGFIENLRNNVYTDEKTEAFITELKRQSEFLVRLLRLRNKTLMEK